jgi:dTDP-4-dehydrorhamnose 3,5-epimerase
MDILEGVIITPLKIIEGANGDVMHVLKHSDSSFSKFGEAYFSTVQYEKIKGWKKHTEMILNIVVPIGEIMFVLYDDRAESKTYQQIMEINLSIKNYQRLTIPSGIWTAFKGLAHGPNILLNTASIEHRPDEAINLPIENDTIPYKFDH